MTELARLLTQSNAISADTFDFSSVLGQSWANFDGTGGQTDPVSVRPTESFEFHTIRHSLTDVADEAAPARLDRDDDALEPVTGFGSSGRSEDQPDIGIQANLKLAHAIVATTPMQIMADQANWAQTAALDVEDAYPGLYEIDVVFGGVQRSLIVDFPADYDRNNPDAYSAIFAFHGGGDGDGSKMLRMGFSEAGETEDFIVIYPSAVDGQWYTGSDPSGINDIQFTTAIAQQLVTNWNVDADALFAAGFSGGGKFVQSLASEVPDVFAGYGVVCSNLSIEVGNSPHTGSDEPMVIFHGTEDPIVPYDGRIREDGTHAPGAEAMVEYWADNNNTEMGNFQALPDTADDGMTTSARVSDDGTVAHFVTEGGGHSWPGLVKFDTSGVQPTQDIDATAIMVDFFSEFGL